MINRISKIFSATAIAFLFASSLAAKDTLFVKVADYGAAGDGITDDTESIAKAFRRALRSKSPSKIIFEDKTYRLGETKERWFHFNIWNCSDLVVEGNGATFMSEPTNQMFSLMDCHNVTLKDFTVDYSPLPFTQGKVKNIDFGKGTIEVSVCEGYPENVLDYYFMKNHGKNGWSHCIIMNPDFVTRNTDMVTDHLYIRDAEELSKGEILIHVADKYVSKMKGMKVGDGFILGLGFLFDRPMDEVVNTRPAHFGNGSCFHINRSSGIKVENVNVYAAPGRAMRITDNQGSIEISGCRLMPRPGTSRAVFTIIDGIHSKNNRGPVIIDGCHIQGTMDDLINCCQMEELVSKVISDTELELTSTDHAKTLYSLDEGNELVFKSPASGKILGTAKIKEIISTDGRRNTVRIEPAISGLVATKNKRADNAVIAMNYGRATSGFRITDNVFVPILRRAVAVLWCDGEISGNTVDCRGGGSIWMSNVSRNFEGPFPRNVIVRENRIVNSEHPSILIGASWATPRPEIFDAGIIVENNVIENQRGGKPAIQISNMKNILLKGNVVSTENESQQKLLLKNCEDIRQE